MFEVAFMRSLSRANNLSPAEKWEKLEQFIRAREAARAAQFAVTQLLNEQGLIHWKEKPSKR